MAATEREGEILLAKANLSRIRLQWSEAEARCVDVLRKNPNNVHAHSLLGDIYRDQQRWDDAAQWYQMALDLNPGSEADKAKLAEVERKRAASASRKPSTARQRPPQIIPSPDDEPLGTQNLLGLNPLTWLRTLVIGTVVFVAILLVVVLTIQRNRALERRTPPQAGGQNSPYIAAPMPPLANTPTRPAMPQVPPPPAAEPPESPEPAFGPLSSGVIAERERDLEQKLSSQAGFGQETSLTSIALDSTGTSATIVLTLALAEGSPEQFMREVILQNATRIAQLAMASDARLDRCTVQARLGNGTNRPETVFRGTVDRATLQTVRPDPSGTQFQNPFRDAWWAPELQNAGQSPAPSSLPGL